MKIRIIIFKTVFFIFEENIKKQPCRNDMNDVYFEPLHIPNKPGVNAQPSMFPEY